MILVRWVALPWVIFQFLVYENPYPPGYEVLGWSLIAALGIGNALLHVVHRSGKGPGRAQVLAVAGILLDIAVISGMVWLYTFDRESALWAILFILPIEGAITFQLRGALAAWLASTIIYTIREIYGSSRFDFDLELNSITYRMGIGLIIALVAGLMARDLVRERARVAAALDDLQRVNELRKALVSTMAHDVRNPLTVIRGALETVLKRRDRLTDDDVTQLLSGADRHARRLEGMATDLLDLARVEAGKLDLNLEDLDVGDALRHAISYLEPDVSFDLRIEEGLCAHADSRRSEQIFVNLTANAVRHGGPPYVVAAHQDDDAIVIDVVDHGPGVAPELQPLLFEPFSAPASSGSVGYGLAIVKALTEAQSGTVFYVPNDSEESCFRVTLPACAGSSRGD